MAENQNATFEAQFLGLISLLSNSALQQLGKVINPVTGKVEKNLEGARLTIDWLRMLKEKTAGNLTEQEDKVLTSYISNLQLNYVDELANESRAKEQEQDKTQTKPQEPTSEDKNKGDKDKEKDESSKSK